MANYATNIFFASTENVFDKRAQSGACSSYAERRKPRRRQQKDLERVETFLDEHFCDCYIDCNEDYINAEFESRWDYPESLIDEMISSLEAKDEIYIRVLTHERFRQARAEAELVRIMPSKENLAVRQLCNEYVSFRVYSGGKWDIRV